MNAGPKGNVSRRAQVLVRSYAGGRAGVLVGARAAEQLAFGLSSLLVARWTGPEAYAPIGALFVINAFAIVASDLGLGLAILSSEPGTVTAAEVRRMRLRTSLIGLVVVLASVPFEGSWRTVGVASGVIWVLAAEAFVRKSAYLRLDRHRDVARAEVVGAVVLLAISCASAVVVADALVVIAVAFGVKHAIEIGWCRRWQDVLGDGGSSSAGAIWWSQLLAYANANVDFVIVGVLISDTAFALYSVGFRTASLIISQLAYAAGRVVTVDLSGAKDDPEATARLHRRAMRLLFLAGLGSLLLMWLVAACVPTLLGSYWRDTAWIIAVLAVAGPWRMVLGVTGSLMIVGGEGSRLVRLEVGRLVVTSAVLAVAALGGLWTFTWAATAIAVASTLVFDRAARARHGIGSWRPMYLAAAPAVAVAAAVAVSAAR